MEKELVEKGLLLVKEDHNNFPPNHELYRQNLVFEITNPDITKKDVEAVRGETWFRLSREFFEENGKSFFREEYIND